MKGKVDQILEFLEANLCTANKNRAREHEGYWCGYYAARYDAAQDVLLKVSDIAYRGENNRCEDCNHSHVVIRDTEFGRAIIQGVIECRIDDPIKGTRYNPIEYPLVTHGKPCYRFLRRRK